MRPNMRLKLFLFMVLALAGLAFSSADARASSGGGKWCKAETTPVIDVKTSTDKVTWDFSKSEKQLNNFNIDTVNPYGKEVITDVGGLMQGGIVTKESIAYKTLTHNGLNQVCYWYDKIIVSLHIMPTIYIASEFPQGSCKHNAIREHEMKHISVDREIVNKYAHIIGQAIQQSVREQSVFGPYAVAHSAQAEAFMKARLENTLKYYSKMMDDERRRRQQLVDTLAEYERVNKMCR